MAQQKRPRVATLAQATKAKQVDPASIQEIFDFWRIQFKKSAGAKLDIKRSRAIGAAIYDYGLDGCRNAIVGCSLSDFHMGRNKTKTKYNDIELILRDSQHIEQFTEIYDASQTVKEDW